MNAAHSQGGESPRTAYMAGAFAILPFLAGTVPFGIVTGIATRAAGLSFWESVAITLLVFSGTAQIAALPLMIAAAVGGGVALAAAALPMKLGLVCGAIAGIVAGALAERAIAGDAR